MKTLKTEKIRNTKSKKGKKNWIKNIDIEEEQNKYISKLKENIIENNIVSMKDEELFTIETKPMTKLKAEFLNKKTKRPQEIRKTEKKILKRILVNEVKQSMFPQSNNNKGVIQTEMVDLWADENNTSKRKKPQSKPLISYPNVPLPHPGQSYNPDRNDLTNLLKKVVELNKPKLTINNPIPLNPADQLEFLSESEEADSQIEEKTNKQVNRKKTRTERNRIHEKKINRLKNKQEELKKKTKVEVNQIKSFKNFEKGYNRTLKSIEEQARIEQENKQTQLKLKSLGIAEE